MRRDHLDALGDRQALGVGRHEEGGKALGAGRLAGAGEDHVEIGDAAVGDPGLLAVEDVAVAVARGGHVHVGDIGAGARLGQREGGDRLAGARLLQPLLLLRRAEQADRAGAEPLHGEGEIGEPVMARQRLAGEAQRAHVERAGIGGIDRRRLQPAVAAELCHQLAAGGVDVVMRDRQVGRAPCVQPLGEIAVAILEERPGEEGAVRHQFPSNTGLSLATKAR